MSGRAAIAKAGIVVGLFLLATAAGCTWFGREPGELPPAGDEPLEGFGSATAGGAGGRVIVVREASEAAIRHAFEDASRSGNAIIRFEVEGPIGITRPTLRLTAPNVTIEGGGATLEGSGLEFDGPLIDVRTHDVIVRDLRLRNGYDNLSVKGPEAFNVVITHVSSTGAADDGISIAYGAHDVTVQYSLLAGNTRSLFCKEGGTTNLSIHHTWMLKNWARSPLLSGPAFADVRNVIVEDWSLWGSRFEDRASGNLIGSLFVLSPFATGVGAKPNAALRFVEAGPVFTADNVYRGAAMPGAAGDAAAALRAPAVRTFGVAEMEDTVRARAGCLPRDRVDHAYIMLRDGWAVSGTTPLRFPLR
jgi:hypothetical protein